MIDWFVLLTPLLVLPVVLIFGFVGCSGIVPLPIPYYRLDRMGEGIFGVYFIYPEGLDRVRKMTVTIIFTDEGINPITVTHSRTALDLVQKGEHIEFDSGLDPDSGGLGTGQIESVIKANCQCTLVLEGIDEPVVLNAHHETLTDFSLIKTGGGFGPNDYSIV